MTCFSRIIAFAAILALGGSWVEVAAHALVTPHFYCESHDGFFHEKHDHGKGTWVATEEHADHDDHCDLQMVFRHHYLPVDIAVVSVPPPVTSAFIPQDRSIVFASYLYGLAPKNSPPVSV